MQQHCSNIERTQSFDVDLQLPLRKVGRLFLPLHRALRETKMFFQARMTGAGEGERGIFLPRTHYLSD